MLPPAILLLWGGAGFLSRGGIASKLHPALFVSLSFLAGSGITGICGLVFIAVGCRILNPAITTILLLTGVFGLRDWIVRIKNWSCPRFSAWPMREASSTRKSPVVPSSRNQYGWVIGVLVCRDLRIL